MNVEMSYLIGMVLGNGEIQRNQTETTVTIDVPYKNLYTDDLKDVAILENALAFGEIGLAGEIRGVSQAQARISESARLGFTKIILPYQNLKNIKQSQLPDNIELVGVRNIREAFGAMVKTSLPDKIDGITST